MQPHIVSRRRRLVALLIGAAVSPAFLFYFFPKTSVSRSVMPVIKNVVTLQQKQAGFWLPVRLRIPVISVDTLIEQAGLTPLGAMEVPKGPADVAWFRFGAHPGEDGTAVIAGHYGWKNNTPAVFDNLYKLHQGDKLFVEDERGGVTVFVVRELRVYEENNDASTVFTSSDEKSHLNLITCQGVWNKTKKSYGSRLVVFTDKEIN